MFEEIFAEAKLPKGFDKKPIKEAFEYAKKAHESQKRKSGDPYISHPIAVAKTLIGLKIFDEAMISAALLHDVVEDTKTTISEVEDAFGTEVAILVHGVTNLGKVDFSTYSTKDEVEEAIVHQKNENLRRLFLSMAEDVRVVVIKLSDRLHNMRTLKALPKDDQLRIAKETLNIFSPLALRLGMGEIKGELEDLAFPIAYPTEYKFLSKEANRRYKAADRYVIQLKRMIDDALKNEKVKAQVSGRSKHIYSLYKKITRPEINWDFDKIYDLVALRIVTETIPDCYRILGIIHGLFRPIPNYIRDYIAAPKPNGYRSIHTSVFGPDGKIAEIQIRTEQMHEEAEFGVASHLHYSTKKEQGVSDDKLAQGTFAKKNQTEFLRRIKEWQDSVKSADEFVEGLKIDFLDDRIYVFSPKGDIYDLPAQATPIDFAYEVHSKLGDICKGAKVNGKIVQLDHKLKTRDVVEIISQKNSSPKRDWLDFVKTSKAKQHIRAYFRKFNYESNSEEGRKHIEENLSLLGFSMDRIAEAQLKSALSETSFKTFGDLCASVGAGLTTPRQAIKIVLGRSFIPEAAKTPREAVKTRQKQDFKGMKVQVAPCCEPGPKDNVICYITRGRGLTAHKDTCSNLSSLEKDRLWEFNPWKQKGIKVSLEITGLDRVGLIRDITNTISEKGINIESFKNGKKKVPGKTNISLTLFVEDMGECADLIKRISSVKDVYSVKRF